MLWLIAFGARIPLRGSGANASHPERLLRMSAGVATLGVMAERVKSWNRLLHELTDPPCQGEVRGGMCKSRALPGRRYCKVHANAHWPNDFLRRQQMREARWADADRLSRRAAKRQDTKRWYARAKALERSLRRVRKALRYMGIACGWECALCGKRARITLCLACCRPPCVPCRKHAASPPADAPALPPPAAEGPPPPIGGDGNKAATGS